MFKKLQNHLQISKYDKLKYKVLELYQSLNTEERRIFKTYMDNFLAEITVYRYMNLPIHNENGSLNTQDMPASVLYIFAKFFGIENPADLMSESYKKLSTQLLTLPRLDKSFTKRQIEKHNIHVPDSTAA